MIGPSSTVDLFSWDVKLAILCFKCIFAGDSPPDNYTNCYGPTRFYFQHAMGPKTRRTGEFIRKISFSKFACATQDMLSKIFLTKRTHLSLML